MPTTSQAPKLVKGVIVAIDLASNDKKQRVIVFQYNPATVSRTLEPPLSEPAHSEGQRALALRYKSAPVETFSLDIELDAADQLEWGDPNAHQLGLYPQLSVLEVLLYPKSDDVQRNDDLLNQGQIEVASGYDAPFTLFVWGMRRVLPVTLTSCSITEEVFDANLNPIQATVRLGLRALSYSDVVSSHKGWNYFMAYQKNKEIWAALGAARDPSRVAGFDLTSVLRVA